MMSKPKEKNEIVLKRLHELLEKSQKVNTDAMFADNEEMRRLCSTVQLYLIDEEIKNEIVLLRAGANAIDGEDNAFRRYAKLINEHAPAVKFRIMKIRRAKEVFDRDKIRERMEGVAARYANTERLELKKKIAAFDPPLDDEQIRFMESKLEDRLSYELERIREIKENFDAYEVVITNYAQSKEYPVLYYALDAAQGSMKQDHVHLRTSVPNLLWYKPKKRIEKRRADMKIEEIVEEYENLCGMIYYQKRDKDKA